MHQRYRKSHIRGENLVVLGMWGNLVVVFHCVLNARRRDCAVQVVLHTAVPFPNAENADSLRCAWLKLSLSFSFLTWEGSLVVYTSCWTSTGRNISVEEDPWATGLWSKEGKGPFRIAMDNIGSKPVRFLCSPCESLILLGRLLHWPLWLGFVLKQLAQALLQTSA